MSDLFHAPNYKERDNVETDFEELNLPHLAHNRHETSKQHEESVDGGDELFNTYRRFLSEYPQTSGVEDHPLPLSYQENAYAVNYQEPKKKKLKNNADYARTIEREVTLWLKLDLVSDDMESLRRRPLSDLFSESYGQIVVSHVPDKPAFEKIQVGDKLFSLNGLPLEPANLKNLEGLISMSPGNLSLAFSCRRLLKLGKLSHLKGDLIDPEKLNETVESLGGFDRVNEKKLWQSVRERLGLQFTTSSSHQLKNSYMNYFSGVLI